MNNRIRKETHRWAGLVCAVAALGAVGACSEDYELDEKNPDWLGTNIYESLNSRGDFKNFVRLIEDLDYKEVLGKTGSKTLFVANDSAFEAFYKGNPWNVSCYDELTIAQKKLLLNSAMINNAYLLEMMSSLEGPEKGECLRRETAADVTDSVPHFTADQLPVSYNEKDKDYWARFRDPQKGGIYLALDATTPMMTHFLPAQMAMNDITDNDFSIFMGQSRQKNDAFIYNSKVLEQDITCQNGYINRLDKVLVPPQNMAEVLRTNGKTNIFSHMIERFSAPFYDDALTKRYRLLYGNSVDSVYQKRYFSLRSQGNAALDNDRGTDPVNNPNGNNVNFFLNFDPGWNEYRADAQTTKENDMGVIFAPSDEKLYNYFFDINGGGHFLLEAYAPELMQNVTSLNDYDAIYRAIDQIPLDVIQALLNNLMKVSFNNSVPSKFETIKDDAQDPMLDETHLPFIKEVMLANNGAIYVMDEVLTPAKYAAVSAPAYVGTDMHIFNYAINQQTLDIDCNFYAYLLAMSARFSFFVPQDEGFWYIDPVSFALDKGKQRALYFEWDAKKNEPKCSAYAYDYDFTTGQGEIGSFMSSVNVGTAEWKNRLRDMLETHTIVHSNDSDLTMIDETETGVECDKHYFLSKNGAPIYVENATGRDNEGNNCKVQGGWQVQHNDKCEVIRFDDKSGREKVDGVVKKTGNGNGYAYEIDKPMSPTIESVYSVLYNTPEFSEFFNLCQTDDEVLEAIDIKTAADKKKYSVFINNNGLPAYDKQTGNRVATTTNVKYFNNYNYTVYVPTNEAIEEAINEKGLPTWQQIRDLLYLDLEPEERPEWSGEEEAEIKSKALAMVTVLINFIKNHFQDNSVYADTPALQEKKYETATLLLDDEGLPSVYAKVVVHSDGNGTLYVTDANDKTCKVTETKNIITRDYVLNSASAPTQISASSSAVVHGINGVLDYKEYAGGKYSSDYATAKARKSFMKHYHIIK